MNYHNMKIDELYKLLNSSINGLDNNEVEKRLLKFGKNKLEESKKITGVIKFLKQFKDVMIIILILSAIASFIISLMNNESFIDSIIIIMIVILNAILGFIQEERADKSIQALTNLQKTKVKVRRNNKIFTVDSEYIVPGDILILEAGDIVCADARIIKQISLKVDESSLTGESIPVEKNNKIIKDNVLLNDKTNMIFSGTNIVYGKCEAIVCSTGSETEFGKIAANLNRNVENITPLQIKINNISKFLSIIIAIIIFGMFIIGIIKNIPLQEMILLSISLAVAAIPEGLPAVITIVLSIGMTELAKKKAIVRKISSVETLGCTEIICSDKTGTITQNKMKVMEVYYNNKISKINSVLKDNRLFYNMILNNNSDENIGDPTEIALIDCLQNVLDVEKLKQENKRIDELTFDSNRKMMSVIIKNEKETVLYTKGSFDSIIDNCTHIYEDNKIIKLTSTKKNDLINVEKKESNKAYRVLAYAYKILDDNYKKEQNLEQNLIFLGLTSMIDPPREEVKESIELCKQAHIKPIMITGDSLSTAVAIAKQIGILNDESQAISGKDIDKLSDKELMKIVDKYTVYARVSPENKYNIVNTLKEKGKMVAMTGDGVNDAPALKLANIGVGMGITGTEVSKNVSDIILSDDSFSSIVTAVREGRRIFDNIRNVLVYLLTGNIAEILIVFIGMFLGKEIFLPIQLLYINLITDSIPAIALAFEEESNDIMKRKVRKNDKTFFTQFLVSKMLISSILKSICVLMVYFINFKLYGLETATTMAFLTLILLEMIFTFTCRNLKKNVINKNIFSNKYINKGLLILLVIQIIVFTTPIKNIFNVTTLNIFQVAYCLLNIITIFIIDELTKEILNNKTKD